MARDLVGMDSIKMCPTRMEILPPKSASTVGLHLDAQLRDHDSSVGMPIGQVCAWSCRCVHGHMHRCAGVCEGTCMGVCMGVQLCA